jgi:type VI secretion system protein VasD
MQGPPQSWAPKGSGGLWFRTSWVAVLLAVAACGGPPPPSPPTVVNVQWIATADANPTADGQGAPVAIRLYQLASKSAFEGAEFFPLLNAAPATLGPDLIKKDEILIAPGTRKSVTLTPTDAVHSIGVFAAYRDFQHATWRADVDIPPNKTTTLTITADRAGIKLATSPGKPAGS